MKGHMPLKMNVLQYSLLSPVDASMDSRGADFSDVDAAGSEAGVVDGIAGRRGIPGIGRLRLAFKTQVLKVPEVSHVLYLHFEGQTENKQLQQLNYLNILGLTIFSRFRRVCLIYFNIFYYK